MHNRRANTLILLGVLSCCFIILGITYGLGVEIPCLFKTITGYPCPGCGGMRSLEALLHGAFYTALRINPLSVLLIAGVAVSCLWITGDIVRGTHTYTDSLRRMNQKYVLWIVLLLLITVWWRNITSGI